MHFSHPSTCRNEPAGLVRVALAAGCQSSFARSLSRIEEHDLLAIPGSLPADRRVIAFPPTLRPVDESASSPDSRHRWMGSQRHSSKLTEPRQVLGDRDTFSLFPQPRSTLREETVTWQTSGRDPFLAHRSGGFPLFDRGKRRRIVRARGRRHRRMPACFDRLTTRPHPYGATGCVRPRAALFSRRPTPGSGGVAAGPHPRHPQPQAHRVGSPLREALSSTRRRGGRGRGPRLTPAAAPMSRAVRAQRQPGRQNIPGRPRDPVSPVKDGGSHRDSRSRWSSA